MRIHDDWFDDFMATKMIVGDENSSSSGGSDKGCLLSVLGILAVFLVFLELIG